MAFMRAGLGEDKSTKKPSAKGWKKPTPLGSYKEEFLKEHKTEENRYPRVCHSVLYQPGGCMSNDCSFVHVDLACFHEKRLNLGRAHAEEMRATAKGKVCDDGFSCPGKGKWCKEAHPYDLIQAETFKSGAYMKPVIFVEPGPIEDQGFTEAQLLWIFNAETRAFGRSLVNG
jgi:hypothetical protein